ncbi:protein singed wings 2 [Cydia strobilella]|uniref:protein singed wings 2 n=1 Tax=Cydia strobilella TaxID=1100964 RepID=UPI0030059BEB
MNICSNPDWRRAVLIQQRISNQATLLSQTIFLLGLTTAAPGLYRHNDTDSANRPCSLIEFTTWAACEQTQHQLLCKGGISNQWMKGIQHKITSFILTDWPGTCLNIGRLQQHFPELRALHLLNCSLLHVFKGHFDESSRIEKIEMHGLTSLWEVPPEIIAHMPALKILDIRNNVLRHMKARLLKESARLEHVYLSDNKWDCSDGGLDWLAMERDNDTVKRKIVDYYKLMCHQQLYRGKPLHKVMDFIRMVRHTCPEPCSCVMTYVAEAKHGGLIPIITANCTGMGLAQAPDTLPPGTTTVRLDGNKIDSIGTLLQNSYYKKIADLYLDNNSLSTVKELEGSEWFNTFRLLSLKGNLLKQIPVYAFDKAFQSNNNIMHVFLGDNPWRCDCHFIPRFKTLLLKYKRVIQDLPDIRCSQSDDKTLSLVQISTLPLGRVCRSGPEMPISTINIINVTLATLLFIVIGRFLYDWHSFKNTGKLPWISSILP